MAAFTAFRENIMASGSGAQKHNAYFYDFENRRLRYEILWAMYENTAYSDLHAWAQAVRVRYGLYHAIRGIRNPAYRLGEFWKSHLLAGPLDLDAGNGEETPSAMPIITDNEAIRLPIGRVWRWSAWAINKDILALRGSVLGDAFIKVVDDPIREKVYMSLVHPGTVRELEKDEFGHIKGYIIEEKRIDPQDPNKKRQVIYTELATRDGDNVVYQTYRDKHLYAWDEDLGAEWAVPYGFVPMVGIQHNNVGLEWGWSEMHPDLSKFREVDDISSKLSDQVRKMVDAPWLFSGVNGPGTTKTTERTQRSSNAPQAGREDVPALYGPVGADAKALVADLDINGAAAYIKDMLAELEQDYPELSVDLHNIQGDISGRALRINQAPASNKVVQRRPNYDDPLVRAQQMAVAIGGWRGYEGFQGFDLDSYHKGDLDHQIGERPVFNKDPMDDLDEEKLFWETAGQAKNFGVPAVVYLKQKGKQYGWDEEAIKEITDSPEFKARLAAMELAANPPTPQDPKLPNRFDTEKKEAGSGVPKLR